MSEPAADQSLKVRLTYGDGKVSTVTKATSTDIGIDVGFVRATFLQDDLPVFHFDFDDWGVSGSLRSKLKRKDGLWHLYGVLLCDLLADTSKSAPRFELEVNFATETIKVVYFSFDGFPDDWKKMLGDVRKPKNATDFALLFRGDEMHPDPRGLSERLRGWINDKWKDAIAAKLSFVPGVDPSVNDTTDLAFNFIGTGSKYGAVLQFRRNFNFQSKDSNVSLGNNDFLGSTQLGGKSHKGYFFRTSRTSPFWELRQWTVADTKVGEIPATYFELIDYSDDLKFPEAWRTHVNQTLERARGQIEPDHFMSHVAPMKDKEGVNEASWNLITKYDRTPTKLVRIGRVWVNSADEKYRFGLLDCPAVTEPGPAEFTAKGHDFRDIALEEMDGDGWTILDRLPEKIEIAYIAIFGPGDFNKNHTPRIAGIDFLPGKVVEPTGKEDPKEKYFWLRYIVERELPESTRYVHESNVRLSFQVGRFRPVSFQAYEPRIGFIEKDVPHQDVLVVPTETNNTVPDEKRTLTIVETLDFDKSLRRRIELTGAGSLVVPGHLIVRPKPLFVGYVREASLVDPEGGNLALKIDDQPWQFFSGDTSLEVSFPPQAIGEEIVRYGKNADNDPMKGNELSRKRSSPPAQFSIRRGRLLRNFQGPPWELLGLIEYADAATAGAEIDEFFIEFLYGLNTHFKQDSDTPLAMRLRLASIESRWGLLAGPDQPPPSTESNPSLALVARFSALAAAYRARISLHEFVDPATSIMEATTVSRGLDFTLRRKADVSEWDPAGRSTGRLKGGATYGVEWKAVRDNLWATNTSHVGWFSGGAVTPLGAYAHQEVEFDNGLTRIIATVFLGRVKSYIVERKGRMSVHWNRAKHVAVYERSVVPVDFGEPHDREGRAVVRKVEEYIEPTQLERPFPDFSSSTNVAPGCVVGTTYPKKIPVDSTWGADLRIGGVLVGYSIRLYKEDVASPAPIPQIFLQFAGHPEDDHETVLKKIENPQIIRFVTLTRDLTSPGFEATAPGDPDLWPEINEVDFTNSAEPVHRDEPEINASNPDGMLNSPSRRSPGFENFSYDLVADGSRVNVTHTRSETAMMANITQVTMMRSKPSANLAEGKLKDRLDILEKVGELKTGMQELFDTLPVDRHEKDDKAGQASAPVVESLSTTIDRIRGLVRGVKASLPDSVTGADALAKKVKDEALALMGEPVGQIEAAIASLAKVSDLPNLRAFVADLPAGVIRVPLGIERIVDELSGAVAAVASYVAELDRVYADACRTIDSVVSENPDALRVFLAGFERDAADLISRQASRVGAFESILLTQIGRALLTLTGGLREVWSQQMRRAFEVVELPLDEFRTLLDDAYGDFQFRVAEVIELVHDQLGELLRDLPTAQVGEDLLSRVIQAILGDPNDIVKAKEEIAKILKDSLTRLQRSKGDAETWITTNLNSLIGPIKDELHQLWESIPDVDTAALGSPADIQRYIDLVADYAHGLDAIASTAMPVAEKALQVADKAIRTVRLFGEPPLLPDFAFNRRQFDYLLSLADKAVRIPPSAALFMAARKELRGLALQVPTRELLDSVIPSANLRNYAFGLVTRSLAGLPFTSLLEHIKVPENFRIVLTPSFDAATKTQYVKGGITGSIARATLFEAGPVTVVLAGARFLAKTEFEAGIDGMHRPRVDGSIAANWEVRVGGMEFVRFEDTELRFNDKGEFSFDLDPRKVRFPGVLDFLSGLLASVNDAGDETGVRIEWENGLPIGASATLALALPPLAFGAFAMQNLQIGGFMKLLLQGSDLLIAVGVRLASRNAPFTLVILFLGGGGWLEVEAEYRPLRRTISTRVSIGLLVTAAISFALGPIRGGVGIELGILVEFTSQGGGATLALTAFIRVYGRVSVLIASINLEIILQLTYDGSNLIGRGSVSIKIKIGFFFKISFSASVQYVFAGGKGNVSALGEDSGPELPGAEATTVETAGVSALPPTSALTGVEEHHQSLADPVSVFVRMTSYD